MLRLQLLFALLATLILQATASADVNVLIVGSNHNNSNIVETAAFSPDAIATELRSILTGHGHATVNVVVEERYDFTTFWNIDTLGSNGFDFLFCSNLASWFHWPYKEGESPEARWSNLRGASGTTWDHVVLIGDPYTIESQPGLYAQGVGSIAKEVAKGSAETILLMPWPAQGSTSTVNHYKEVVYRTGRSGGIKVAPAALAWVDAGSPVDATHPSAAGAYIAAASIYSSMYEQSARNSGHGDLNLADTAHTAYTTNKDDEFYFGKFDFQNAYKPFEIRTRDATSRNPGNDARSTEHNFKNASEAAHARSRVSTPNNGAAYYHGREYYRWTLEEHDQAHYTYTPATARVFAYPYHCRNNDNDIHIGRISCQEFRLAHQLTSESDRYRILPRRLMWAEFHKERPLVDPTDANPGASKGTHLNVLADISVGTYMYTLFSSRCPVDPKPDPVTDEWLAQKIGYETAWQLAYCQTRAPGFKVMPSSATAKTIDANTSETMTVQFILPPENDVTVTVNSTNTSAAIVGPRTLLFTPENYNVPQEVVVKSVPGPATGVGFDIQFSTSSDDEVYDGLFDKWDYTNTRSATTVTRTDYNNSLETYKDLPINVELNASGASAGNTTFAGPNHGTLSWNGENVTYTPNTGYAGPDGFAYYCLNGSTLTTGSITINVLDSYPDGSVRLELTDSTATEEGTTTATFNVIREGTATSAISVNLTAGGTAIAGTDYTLNPSIPVEMAAGVSLVEITLTPIDDAVFEAFGETAVFTVGEGSGYTALNFPATITIADNDNTPPEVDAGTNRTAALLITDPNQTLASGGTVINYTLNGTNYNAHIFTTSGTLTVSSGGDVEYLIVAGGGGGGDGHNSNERRGGGGGGAGGLLTNVGGSMQALTEGTYNVVVGTGGAAGKSERSGSNGGNSSFDGPGITTITAIGGGGGGGAGEAGSTDANGYGGDGAQNSITGTDIWYAGGGAGGKANADGPNGTLIGGLGGGGNSLQAGTDGLGGGGGGGYYGATAAKGGSGIVIVRYSTGTYVEVQFDDATAIDPDGDDLDVFWEVVSTDPPGLPDPIFSGDVTLGTAAAIFTASGTYELRLTADDTFDTHSDTITITIDPPLPANYVTWANGDFANPFTNTAIDADPDGDSISSLLEFAFGTDPTTSESRSLATDGSAHGQPKVTPDETDEIQLFFLRRKDHNTAGSVTYSVEFSNDLTTFTPHAVEPTFVADSSADTDYEVVKVPYPAETRFGRIVVQPTP